MTFHYDREMILDAPEGVEAILVEVRQQPKHGVAIVYGRNKEGQIQAVPLDGSRKFELPFTSPRVMVRYAPGAEHFGMVTLGYRP